MVKPKLIFQTEAAECGLACLGMVANHFGRQTDLPELRRQFSVSLKGMTLAQLIRHAAALQLNGRPLRLDVGALPKLTLPCILHWDLNHFVVLTSVKKSLRGRVVLTLLDPAVGERKITLEEASKHFTGIALELTPGPAFEIKDERRQIKIRELTGPIIGLRRAVVQVIVLALTLEVFAVIAPLFNQFVIDEVINSGDQDLLLVLTLGFALLMVTQNAIGLARSWFLMRWSMDINFQWNTRIFFHLLRLPGVFFEKRHLGDIVSRFGSIGAIQTTLTGIFVESVLDGLMAFIALGMMFFYSAQLSVIVLIALLLYGFVRILFYQPFREATEERLVLSAKENSHFLETIRAITPLKLFGKEFERLGRWQNLKVDVQNRDIQTQKLAILFKVSRTVIFGTQSLILFYIGAELVMQNTLSIGMLLAFSAYAGTFGGRASNLIDVLINLRMLSLHAERLADIVMEKPETSDGIETDASRLDPVITLRNVKFRYADGEPWILNGVNLTMNAGQSVALVGPSGCGKTTLCKIMLGLLKPVEGDILIGGIPISQIGNRAYRNLIGTVMQEDVLLTGSILDNIVFFDAQIDWEFVESCAKVAAIHDEIVRMPMGYQTLIGDMGSSLSGGQKQRILLARALYKKPKILALDEATSHLDVANEQKVSQALQQIQITRIMVAHRPETIAAADRVIQLEQGMAVEVENSRPSADCEMGN